MQGGAFRLPNGNTLVTDCDSADIKEFTSNGVIGWRLQIFSDTDREKAQKRRKQFLLDFQPKNFY